VTLEALDGPPSDLADEWEAVVEVSMFTTSGQLQVQDRGGPPVEGLTVEVEPGPIRVRVSARDRDSEERE
jgi:hypothetical protein